jgi:GT2 family glycosyltransferase
MGSAVGEAPEVSVVIITRDRVEPLKRCVESILAERRDRLQLVILDNGTEASAERLRPFLDEVARKVDLSYRRCAPSGFAEMRRQAVGMARGEFIMSIDDDCVAGAGAISHIVERFRSDDAIGIVGGNIENVGFSGAERFKGRGRIGINGRYETVEDSSQAEIFGSANKSIRRSAYRRVGGYDPFFSSGMEEADLALSVRAKGYRVVYEPLVRITHQHHPGRFRGRWENLNVMRLYLFFKHFMPQNGGEWLAFLRREWGLFLDDLSRLSVARRVEAGAGGRLYASALVALDLLKIILARLAIPYLVLRARRSRPA